MRRLTNLFASLYESNSTNNRLINTNMDMQCREMSLVGNPGALFLSLAVSHLLLLCSYSAAIIQLSGAFTVVHWRCA